MFAFLPFQEKEKVRKACIQAFKRDYKYKGRRLFVGDDLSQRVQAPRKALLPTLKQLQQEGKKAFYVYPAIIKFVDNEEDSTWRLIISDVKYHQGF